MSKYTDWVKTLPCCHTGQFGVDAHHLIGVDKMGQVGGKNHDITAMPLLRWVHNEVHKAPKEWPETRWMVETQVKGVKAGKIKL